MIRCTCRSGTPVTDIGQPSTENPSTARELVTLQPGGYANATLQIARVARERKLSQELVRQLVREHTFGPQLGFLGSARVSVLELNLKLDGLTVSVPSPASP